MCSGPLPAEQRPISRPSQGSCCGTYLKARRERRPIDRRPTAGICYNCVVEIPAARPLRELLSGSALGHAVRARLQHASAFWVNKILIIWVASLRTRSGTNDACSTLVEVLVFAEVAQCRVCHQLRVQTACHIHHELSTAQTSNASITICDDLNLLRTFRNFGVPNVSLQQ